MGAEDLLDYQQVERGIDIAGAFFGDDPGAAIGAFERILLHENGAAGEVDRPVAQIELAQLLAGLSFELLGEGRVAHASLGVDPFHAGRVTLAHIGEGNYGVGAGSVEQVDGTIYILGEAQRVGRLQREDRIVGLTHGFEPPDNVLQNRDGGRVVLGQFGRTGERNVDSPLPSDVSNFDVVGGKDRAREFRTR